MVKRRRAGRKNREEEGRRTGRKEEAIEKKGRKRWGK